jgi:hypothetical protein
MLSSVASVRSRAMTRKTPSALTWLFQPIQTTVQEGIKEGQGAKQDQGPAEPERDPLSFREVDRPQEEDPESNQGCRKDEGRKVLKTKIPSNERPIRVPPGGRPGCGAASGKHRGWQNRCRV